MKYTSHLFLAITIVLLATACKEPTSSSPSSSSSSSSSSSGSSSSSSSGSSPGSSAGSSPSVGGSSPPMPSAGRPGGSSGSGSGVVISSGGVNTSIPTSAGRSSGSSTGSQANSRANRGDAPADSGQQDGRQQDGTAGSNIPAYEPGPPNAGASDDIDFSEDDPCAAASRSASSGKPSGTAGSPTASGPARTDGERVGELDARLEESMADYDGMILRERDYVLSRGNQQGSEDAVAAADAGALPYDEAGAGETDSAFDEAPATAGAQATAAEGTPSPGSSSGGGNRPAEEANREGDYEHRGSSPPPPDIPDGSDDDVVARQIREAAMQETDPELREKLWEEYRKYKNQSR